MNQEDLKKVMSIRDSDLDASKHAKGCQKADKTKAKNRQKKYLEHKYGERIDK